jgi:hypothetical protein
MRKGIFAVAMATAFWCTSAAADTIVTTISATNRTAPVSLTLFNPTLGSLTSVQIQGTLSFEEPTMRPFDPFGVMPAVSNPVSAPFTLVNAGLGTTLVNGTETYDVGQIFGEASGSASVFALLTGTDVNPFIAGAGGTSTLVFATGVFPTGLIGKLVSSPGSTDSFSLTYTYTYVSALSVPEPSTWAMMLLGFAGIGLVCRSGKRGQIVRPRSCLGDRSNEG